MSRTSTRSLRNTSISEKDTVRGAHSRCSHTCGLKVFSRGACPREKRDFNFIPSSADDGTLRGSCVQISKTGLFRQAEATSAKNGSRFVFIIEINTRSNRRSRWPPTPNTMTGPAMANILDAIPPGPTSPSLFKLNGRRDNGVGKARHRHQCTCAGIFGQTVVAVQRGEQGGQEDERHGRGGSGAFPIQSQCLPTGLNELAHGADPAADQKSGTANPCP